MSHLQTSKRKYMSAENGWLAKRKTFQEPPFPYCGFDMFCPILLKEGCKEMKRYGCLFTCLSSRAIHIESTNSLSTDAFIQALQRFLSRRGNVESTELITAQILLGAVQNWTWHFWRWTTRTSVHAGAWWPMDPVERESSYC